jgi:hypothetical protein
MNFYDDEEEAEMKRIHTSSGEGWKIQNDKGWFYLGVGGHIYALHLSIGPVDITVQAGEKKRTQAKAARRAAMEKMREKR